MQEIYKDKEVQGLLKYFMPNEHVKSIFDIDPKKLKKQGIKGIITDLDNTLVPWNVKEATQDVIDWLKLMDDHDIKVTIISNNKMERVKMFSEPLKTPYVFSAKKPLGRAFKRTAREMGMKKDEIVVLGDQLLTDVLGGNRAGFYTIMVTPIVETDGFLTRFNRKLERRLLAYMRKKGKITWEE